MILNILIFLTIVVFFLFLLSKSNLDFTGILDYLTERYVIKKKGGTLIIIDGDTFWSKRHNNKIRILGIDCPEKGEPGHQEAKDFLYELLKSSTLRIKKKGIDKYGRVLAEIFVNGENIALKIKEKGFDKLNSTYKEKFPEPVKILSDTVEEIKEEFRCETCHKEISEKEYYEFNGLCQWCRGAPTQKGFPSPPGFPRSF
ncbi:MAG: thermonuclease family protein [Nitrospirota bacterium]